MTGKENLPACPVETTLCLISDRWKVLILRDLLSDYPQGRFELDWVATLAEGVQALRANRHDVFLVDYHLGPDNGMDLVRLAVAEQSAHRPVIMLTGQGNAEVDREALVTFLMGSLAGKR